MATASLAGCAALVAAAGLFGMVTRSAVPAGPSDRARAQSPAEVRELPIPAVRLRDLSGGRAASATRRNPFSFNAELAPSQPARPRLSSARPPATLVADPTPPPSIVLAGIAERHTAEGVSRTALMIVGNGELTMATIGQPIAPELTVDEIGPDRVVLVDRVRMTRLTVRLALPDP